MENIENLKEPEVQNVQQEQPVENTEQQPVVEDKKEFAFAEISKKLQQEKQEKETWKSKYNEVVNKKENLDKDSIQQLVDKLVEEKIKEKTSYLDQYRQETVQEIGQKEIQKLLDEGFKGEEVEKFLAENPKYLKNPYGMSNDFRSQPKSIEYLVNKKVQQQLQQQPSYIPPMGNNKISSGDKKLFDDAVQDKMRLIDPNIFDKNKK